MFYGLLIDIVCGLLSAHCVSWIAQFTLLFFFNCTLCLVDCPFTLRARFLCMHTVLFVDCPLCVINFVCIENVCLFNFNLVSDSQGVTASHAQHPGFDSHRLHNHGDWWLSPVTLPLEDKDMGWSW